MRIVVLVLALAGCRINFDRDAVADSGDGDGGADAGCAPWTAATQFTTPAPVAILNSPETEQQPHTSADGLAMYFSSMRTGSYRIYVADRVTVAQPFANVRLVSGVNGTSGYDTAFTPTPDHLTGYLSSDRDGPIDLYVTQRASTAQPFGTPAPMTVSTAFTDYDPFPSADGLRLYFVILAWDQGLGGTDLVVSTRASTSDAFGPPSLVAALNTTEDEDNPAETADGRMLVFSSQRGGTYDLYFTSRATPTDSYGPPVIVPMVNEIADDAEPHVSADGCELWFVSDRGGNDDIYVSRVIGD